MHVGSANAKYMYLVGTLLQSQLRGSAQLRANASVVAGEPDDTLWNAAVQYATLKAEIQIGVRKVNFVAMYRIGVSKVRRSWQSGCHW